MIDTVTINEDIILVDKPTGWTSFDVVAKVRGQLSRRYLKETGEKKRIKVGHTGTLDPAATGLLVLAVGKATKTIESLTKLDKVYEVEATLGVTSTTGDSEGELSETGSKTPASSIIAPALEKFTGDIMQTPPKFSAIKINGVRAYKLARAGKEVKMKPRPATIYYIEDVVLSGKILKFTCKVSSGTYIRSLVEDIGAELSCGAYMSALRRTSIGEFDIKDAVSVD